MDAMTWQVATAAIGGLIGQFFKAQVNVKNWIPQVLMLVSGLVCYLAFNPPGPKDFGWGLLRYFIVALVAAASVNGTASLIGQFTPALKSQEVPR
jgi:hypothetical protein